jgi:hypothetical protein
MIVKLTPRKVHILRVLEQKVLRRILGIRQKKALEDRNN